MVKHPDIQKRVQEELDEAVGRERLPRWDDRSVTPFTEAVLHEVQRLGDVVPNGVVRATSRDVRFAGFNIPAGTAVMPFLSSVLKDPVVFAEPEQFKPERFLSAGDSSFTPSPHVLAFGAGKRRCLGETLAKIELYLFFTCTLHRFTAEADPCEDVDIKVQSGSVSQPPKFKVRFISRHLE
jgi:cytochrome P450